MKKILTLSLFLFLIAAAASAQQVRGDRILRHRMNNSINSGQVNRFERFQLRKDAMRYRMTDRRFHRDGRVTPFERRKLYKLKRQGRQDLFRFRHNGRRRVI